MFGPEQACSYREQAKLITANGSSKQGREILKYAENEKRTCCNTCNLEQLIKTGFKISNVCIKKNKLEKTKLEEKRGIK